jgi:hypothetical protein
LRVGKNVPEKLDKICVGVIGRVNRRLVGRRLSRNERVDEASEIGSAAEKAQHQVYDEREPTTSRAKLHEATPSPAAAVNDLARTRWISLETNH